jgi:hypothetical protein
VVLPSDVRITSISPAFREDGLVELSMTCEAKTAEGMVLTIDRFNASQYFANPFPSSETTTEQGYRFTLSVNYRPSIPRAAKR